MMAILRNFSITTAYSGVNKAKAAAQYTGSYVTTGGASRNPAGARSL